MDADMLKNIIEDRGKMWLETWLNHGSNHYQNIVGKMSKICSGYSQKHSGGHVQKHV